MSHVIDAVIPVYRPDGTFDELLRRLAAQMVPVRRVVVINTEERYWNRQHFAKLLSDLGKTPDWLLVRHIRKSEFDHGGSRNLGVRLSDAEIFLCMTMDAIPRDRNLTANLLRLLTSAEDIAAVYGRQLPCRGCGTIERYTRQFNYPAESRVKSEKDLPELGIKAYFCSNVCAMYRRDIWEKLGGFTERTIFNEDMIYAGHAEKTGYRIGYAADAEVIHSHNYSGFTQLHRNFDLAVSQTDHPEVFGGIRSEGEGVRLVRDTAFWLLKNGDILLLPKLVWQSGCKYLGYRLGHAYRKLPRWLILSLTMNRSYWEKN
jgi:rhamnosyltransferase